MRRSTRAAALVVVSCVVALGAVTQATAAGPLPKPGPGQKLNFYSALVSAEQYRDLLSKGLDIAAADAQADAMRLQMVLIPSQVRNLRAQGITVKLIRNKAGRTAIQEAAAQKSSGYTVWRDYDGPDGFAAEIRRTARANPDVSQAVAIGTTGQGRTIWALKVTAGARGAHPGRPSVLYSSLQHAREWIAGEINWRLAEHYIARWRANDKAIKSLLQTTELWFVPVANPDGYQYTFQSPATRLWRKTLRDNNENGTVEVGDGVDPNRNFPEHWNYDNEGSSGVPSSDTYRGPEAASEPETQAMIGLLQDERFKFQVNYHSFGRWLLYPEGWQTGTPTADDPIYYALSGNLDNPAIGSHATGDAFHPGLSSDVLYVTNGETTDYAHAQVDTLAWTPELSEGSPGSGFVFPDDPALVAEEFKRNLPFALDVAKSAKDPDDPVSHLGLETEPFQLTSPDTYKAGIPGVNFAFPVSYGDPQMVRVLAKRDLGAVEVKYRVNGGPVQSAPTTEWDGGEKYGSDTDVYYRVLDGFVSGTGPGDSVEVWFEAESARSDSFTYEAQKESGRRVLVMAAEDYTGTSPGGPRPGPEYLDDYVEMLAANGIQADVYDVDANGRRAPDAIGILSHYDAVVWYTGRDSFVREPGSTGNEASRLGMDQLFEIREYLNEGGRVLYTGDLAGGGYTTALGFFGLYDPTAENAFCEHLPAGTDPRRCLFTFGSPASDLVNDVIEYWFGAYLFNFAAGNSATGFFPVTGTDTPFGGMEWMIEPGVGFDFANSFITTSGILPPDEYPQFESWPAAKFDRPGGPFAPHSGEGYAYSQIADVSYKRLTKTVNVPAGGGEMTFWTSYNTEPDWDFVFVEAHTGDDDWTTLPDENGHTSQSTGSPCPQATSGGWRTLHPWLDHYQTQVGTTGCSPTGTTGEWHATSGDSHGWQQWRIDLDEYAGEQVELSITYATDWATQGLGVFVDDVVFPDGSTAGFEGDLSGFSVPGPPPGSAPNANDWIATDAEGFPEAAVVATPDTLYFGHGLEGIDPDQRDEVMGEAMEYLLRP